MNNNIQQATDNYHLAQPTANPITDHINYIRDDMNHISKENMTERSKLLKMIQK